MTTLTVTKTTTAKHHIAVPCASTNTLLSVGLILNVLSSTRMNHHSNNNDDDTSSTRCEQLLAELCRPADDDSAPVVTHAVVEAPQAPESVLE